MCTVVPPPIHEIVKKVIKGDIENFDVVIHDPNKKGDGFLGEVVFITLKHRQSNEVFDLVVKQAFVNQIVRDNNPIRQVFMNEIYFYSQVWTRLNKIQERIPTSYQFHKLPKYFASISEDASEKLVLENLKIQKFQVHSKSVALSKEHYELIFREYGKFHALSFAYKSLYPEDYANLTKGALDIYLDFINRDGFRKAIKIVNDIAMDALQPGTDDVLIEKFKPYVEDYVELFRDSIECNTKYSVITHGDCWSNNIMFKYNAEDGKLIDVRFLDFQLSKEGSPCCDLSYSLYSGASREQLKDFNHFLQIYHDSLSETLKAFGCDPEKIYPFRELKNDWKKHCQMGVMMSLMIWKVKCTPDENLFDLNDTDLSDEEKENAYYENYDKVRYQQICKDLISHLYENDFL